MVSHNSYPDVELNPVKILLIDDDESHNQLLTGILTSEGHDVLAANDGMEGLEILRREKDIDFIIVDEVMPYMSGLEFKKKVAEEFDQLPSIYLLTGNETRELWNSKVLYKPITVADLRAIIKLERELNQL